MVQYGTIVIGTVIDQNDSHYFVQYEGLTYAVVKPEVEDLAIGTSVEGMIYENKAHKRVMQVDLPTIRPGVYGWGTVVNVRKDLGVFVDVGLVEKEVVVSLDDLPENTALWPKREDKLYLTYEVDSKNRFWGKIAEPERMQKLMQRAPQRLNNQNIEATVYRVKLAGSLCITAEGYSGFLHESEVIDTPRLGQQLQARVIGVREDGGINLSIKPRAHEALDDDAGMIQALLTKAPRHFLALHDKSQPDVIQAQLGISKAQFKRAVGTLMKQGIVRQVKGEGIYLNESN